MLSSLFKKDSWRNETSCWIRECRRNRRALFTPIGTKDGPNIYILTGERITRVFYCDGTKDIIRDSWLDDGSTHRILKKPWTGSTYFPLVGRPPQAPVSSSSPAMDDLWFALSGSEPAADLVAGVTCDACSQALHPNSLHRCEHCQFQGHAICMK